MKTTFHLSIAALGLATFNLSPATLYVSLESPAFLAELQEWTGAPKN